MSDRGQSCFYVYFNVSNNALYFLFPPEIKSSDEYRRGWFNFVSFITSKLGKLGDNYL